MEAVKPFLHTLLENRCYTAYDLLYNVRGVGELVSWNIPRPLANSIYRVIQEMYEQSTHISKRNILRQVRASGAFEHFLETRTRKQDKVSASSDTGQVVQVVKPPESHEPATADMLDQVKARLESDVLGLPLQDTTMPASDFVFKAAFLTDESAGNPTAASYQSFLQSLVALQVAGNTDMMKQLVAARVAHAKLIADGHSDVFELFGVSSAGDLMVRKQEFPPRVHSILTA
jgi:hypothetical protein